MKGGNSSRIDRQSSQMQSIWHTVVHDLLLLFLIVRKRKSRAVIRMVDKRRRNLKSGQITVKTPDNFFHSSSLPIASPDSLPALSL